MGNLELEAIERRLADARTKSTNSLEKQIFDIFDQWFRDVAREIVERLDRIERELDDLKRSK